MKNYTFDTLSSMEFEHLSRDLLQAELGVMLESFSSGADQGIDARWVSTSLGGTQTLVVQCKHYWKSGFGKLLRALEKERNKLANMEVARYILTTSVELTPAQKEKLLTAGAPYILAPGDIYGKDDLNNLLGRHEDVERRHYKLWLTSSIALAKLYEAPTFLDSEAAVSRMRERLKRYVQNESFRRGLQLLEQHRFCVIVGNPGIGKTTLAEALLVRHVDLDFQAVRVTNRLAELKGLTDPNQKQIFYYDDFLGKTGVDRTENNEDQRLVEFLETVENTPKWRFVLTTRDYILNTARARSETLAHFPFDIATCAVYQEDYTRPIRARILYNHLYFSSVPAAARARVLQRSVYERIVEHRNYNPRLVEHMTDARRLREVIDKDYIAAWNYALENPSLVWEHAFRTHISDAARNALLVLFVLPDNALLPDFSRVFWRLHGDRAEEYNTITRPDDFENALKELDGNFVLTDRSPIGLAAKFQNPSVRDFLEIRLREISRDVQDLVKSIDRTIHFRRLWQGRRGSIFPWILANPGAFTTRFINAIQDELNVERERRQESHFVFEWQTGWYRLGFTLEIRAQFPNNESADKLVRLALAAFANEVQRRDCGKDDVMEALKALQRGAFPESRSRRALVRRAQEYLLEDNSDLYDFTYAADFVRMFRTLVRPAEREALKQAFTNWVDDRVRLLSYGDDARELRDDADQAEYIADVLKIDVNDQLEAIRGQANANEIEEDPTEPSALAQLLEVVGDDATKEQQYAEIERDFSSLRNELS